MAPQSSTKDPSLSPPPGFRTLQYDLLNFADAGSLLIAGDPKTADKWAIFLTGFPDSQHCFCDLAKKLVEETTGTDGSSSFYVGIVCLPEYDRVGVLGLEPLKNDGYDADEMCLCFHQAVDCFRKHGEDERRKNINDKNSKSRAPKFHLLSHDIGLLPATSYAVSASNANSVDKFVAFDIGPDLTALPDTNYELINHLSYRSFFAATFVLWRFMPALAYIFFQIGFFLNMLFVRWTNPAGPRDINFTNGEGATINMENFSSRQLYLTYPYLTAVIKPIFDRKKLKLLKKKLDFEILLTKQPVLFIYGEEKNTMFHNAKTLRRLKETKGCEVMAVSGAGHWVHKQELETCFVKVKDFLLR